MSVTEKMRDGLRRITEALEEAGTPGDTRRAVAEIYREMCRNWAWSEAVLGVVAAQIRGMATRQIAAQAAEPEKANELARRYYDILPGEWWDEEEGDYE